MTIQEQIQDLEETLNLHRQGITQWSSEELKVMTTILAQLKRDLVNPKFVPEPLRAFTKEQA